MAMSVEDIAALLSREGSGLTPDEYDESVEQEGARARRTELLAPVLETCQQLWKDGNDELDVVAEKIGDGSRDSEFPCNGLPPTPRLGIWVITPAHPGDSGMAHTVWRLRNSGILP